MFRQNLMAPPTLDTPHLILRGHTIDDFDQSALLWSDPEVVKFISGKPSTREESWARLLRYIGHWQALGFGYWVIEEKGSGAYLGEAGLADYKRNMTPDIEGKAEAGWVLSTNAQGKGYGIEAVLRILQWADEYLPKQTTVCIITPEHHASMKLATAAGFRRVQTSQYHGQEIDLLERVKSGGNFR